MDFSKLPLLVLTLVTLACSKPSATYTDSSTPSFKRQIRDAVIDSDPYIGVASAVYNRQWSDAMVQTLDLDVFDYYDPRKLLPDEPTTAECKAFFVQTERTENHFEFFIDGPMAKIDTTMTELNDKYEVSVTRQGDYSQFLRIVGNVLEAARLAGKYPPLNSMDRAATLIKNLLVSPMNSVNSAWDSFNNKVEPINVKARQLKEANANAAELIVKAQLIVQEYVVDPLLLVDKYCKDQTASSICHPDLVVALSNVNDKLDTIRDQINGLSSWLSNLDPILGILRALQTPTLDDFFGFLGDLSVTLDAIDAVLNYKICVPAGVLLITGRRRQLLFGATDVGATDVMELEYDVASMNVTRRFGWGDIGDALNDVADFAVSAAQHAVALTPVGQLLSHLGVFDCPEYQMKSLREILDKLADMVKILEDVLNELFKDKCPFLCDALEQLVKDLISKFDVGFPSFDFNLPSYDLNLNFPAFNLQSLMFLPYDFNWAPLRCIQDANVPCIDLPSLAGLPELDIGCDREYGDFLYDLAGGASQYYSPIIFG